MNYVSITSGLYEITLLTKEEYEKYSELHRIPMVNAATWWWLQSPGNRKDSKHNVSVVDAYGEIFGNGTNVGYVDGAVRPVLKSKILNYNVGTCFGALGNTWIMIDDNVAISYDVVSHHRYDAKSNEWETSELKMWLEQWARDREETVTHDYYIVATIGFDNVTAEDEDEAKEMVKAWLRDGIDPDDGSVSFDVWGGEE